MDNNDYGVVRLSFKLPIYHAINKRSILSNKDVLMKRQIHDYLKTLSTSIRYLFIFMFKDVIFVHKGHTGNWYTHFFFIKYSSYKYLNQLLRPTKVIRLMTHDEFRLLCLKTGFTLHNQQLDKQLFCAILLQALDEVCAYPFPRSPLPKQKRSEIECAAYDAREFIKSNLLESYCKLVCIEYNTYKTRAEQRIKDCDDRIVNACLYHIFFKPFCGFSG